MPIYETLSTYWYCGGTCLLWIVHGDDYEAILCAYIYLHLFNPITLIRDLRVNESLIPS